MEGENKVEELNIIEAVDSILDSSDETIKFTIAKIVNKIVKLPLNKTTTIAELIEYNPEVNFQDPLSQGIIYNNTLKVCKKLNIELEEIRDEFGGLAYHNKFKKI
jgi:hypothetical protein